MAGPPRTMELMRKAGEPLRHYNGRLPPFTAPAEVAGEGPRHRSATAAHIVIASAAHLTGGRSLPQVQSDAKCQPLGLA